jgi:hypothetical protein
MKRLLAREAKLYVVGAATRAALTVPLGSRIVVHGAGVNTFLRIVVCRNGSTRIGGVPVGWRVAIARRGSRRRDAQSLLRISVTSRAKVTAYVTPEPATGRAA